MNITTALLLFLAWQMFGKGGGGGLFGRPSNSSPNLSMLSNLLNDDTKSLIDSVSKVGSPSSTGEDKMAAVFQLMTNPTVNSVASSLFNNGSNSAKNTNDAGYVYKDNPSTDAIEFFKPIENIAGVEASRKLYQLYDNWYSKRK